MADHPLKVLLIEDNPVDALLVRGLLADLPGAPFTVASAGQLSEGLEQLTAGGIDIVLLDLHLPDGEGLDNLVRLRQRSPHVPVVVLTGLEDDALALRALQEGAQDYLVKGRVDHDSLARSLRYAVERNHLKERLSQQDLKLAETTALLNSILESSTEYGIIATDWHGNILTWNEGARRNTGYTAAEMVGKENVRRLYTLRDVTSGKLQVVLDTALQSGKAEGVFERVRKDEIQFPTSLVVTLRKDARGVPAGFLFVSRDITAQKALEEQLHRTNEELAAQNRHVQQASRLKSEFLANMSHELRTPLNGIIGFAELMHDGRVGPISPDHKEYLGDILTSAHHLLELINDVLDLAKVEAGGVELRPESVDPAKVVAEVRNIVRAIAARKRIRIDTEVEPALGRVVVDPAKLKQVLYNYLSNALKFTPDQGRVTIRVLPHDASTFRVEVEDTGIGIKPEDMGRLFVEFQQLDAGMSKKAPGTGLGLALTRRIVEAQGGQVGARSTPGQGSTFFAVLPRVVPVSAVEDSRGGRKGREP